MLTLLTTVLVAAPVQLDVLGFSVEERDGAVVVVEVLAGSPAAVGGLTPGMRIQKVVFPFWPFLRSGKLVGIPDADVRDALTPGHGDKLVLNVSKDGRRSTVELVRSDPAPAQLFTEELPPERVERLSMTQHVQYMSMLPTFLLRKRPDAGPAPVPTLTFSAPRPVALVSSEGVESVKGGGWTPAWLSAVGTLTYDCARGTLDSVESADGQPLAKVVVPRTERSGGTAEVQFPLWRTGAVAARCAEASPPGGPLAARVMLELRCHGLPPARFEFESALEVTCVPPQPLPVFDLIRVSPRWLEAGKPGRVSVDFVLPPSRPPVVQIDLIELGPKTRPRASVFVDRGLSSVSLDVDTAQAGAVTFLPVARFADGSREFGRPRRVAVGTQPFDDPLALVGREKKLEALRRELAARRACTTPAAVAWLAAQPGVTESERLRDSVSFSFEGLPLVVQCPE